MPMRVHKDISASPTSGGLSYAAKPEDAARNEAEVQRNLRLWGVLEALRQGRIPSNSQLDAFIALIIKRFPRKTSHLSADTINALAATRSLLETARLVLREKNADELMQETLWLMFVESRGGSRRTAMPTPGVDAPSTIDTDLDAQVSDAAAAGKDEGELALAARHIRALATIIATNSDLRSALSELVIMVREMLSSKPEATGDGDPEPNGADSVNTDAPAVPDTASDFHMPGGYEAEWDDDDDSAEEEFADALEDLDKPDPKMSEFKRRCKAAVVSLQNSPGYPEAMEWLLDVFEAYETQSLNRRKREGEATPGTPHFVATQGILNNVMALLERFANGRSLEPIQEDIGDLYDDVAARPELRALWRDVDMWIRRVLLERGYVDTIECDMTGRMLRARGKEWLENELYAAHWKALCGNISSWLGIATGGLKKGRDWFRDDPTTRRLETDYTRLVSALIKDSRGRPTFKRHVWTELAGLVFPATKEWGYITLPRVELSTPKIELVLENVHIALANVLPSLVKFEEHDMLTVSPFDQLRSACEQGSRTRLRFQASQIQAEVRDALIALDWKSMGIKASGIVDIILARQGLSIDVTVDVDTRHSSPYVLRLVSAKVSFDEAAFSARGTHRDGLYRLLLPTVAVPLLKLRMSMRMKQKIRRGLRQLNAELVLLRDRILDADKDAVRRQRLGEAVPRPTARMWQIIQARVKEWKDASTGVPLPPPPRRPRRGSATSNASTASTASTASVQSVAEPGGPPKPIRKFKISSRLEDAILPDMTHDATASIVYRRSRAEQASRRMGDVVAAIGSSSSASMVSATATGMRGWPDKRWRSPVFTMNK